MFTMLQELKSAAASYANYLYICSCVSRCVLMCLCMKRSKWSATCNTFHNMIKQSPMWKNKIYCGYSI